MKMTIVTFMLCVGLMPLGAEVRTGINAEFYNTVASIAGIDGQWSYLLTGQAGISFKNTGSREVRGEIALNFTEAGFSLMPYLKRFYIRPRFGGSLVSIGKTRTTWGAGFAFNAGDIIFGSDSTDFDTQASDPRGETAWLTNIQIPIGAFSFLEAIVLPGNVDMTNPLLPALPTLDKTSVGGRLSFEAGVLNIQAGYLYRGDQIAGLGSPGHRAFISLEGIAPFDWHLSSSTSTDVDVFNEESIKNGWIITGGVSYDHNLGAAKDYVIGWRLEFLVKPFASFDENGESEDGEYGLFLFPSLAFIPPGNVVYNISSVVSPVDLSANINASVSWNIYEALSLLGFYAFQIGGEDDLFNLDNPGGMSLVLGAKYSY